MEDLEKAAALIAEAKRPVILAGHGVLLSGAMDELRLFAEKTQTPVAMTLLGLGAVPASHPYSLGMMGMHGEAYCNEAIQNADLLLAFGMRFDDRVTGHLRTYAPRARVSLRDRSVTVHRRCASRQLWRRVKVGSVRVGWRLCSRWLAG